jgi:hypothetical protein
MRSTLNAFICAKSTSICTFVPLCTTFVLVKQVNFVLVKQVNCIKNLENEVDALNAFMCERPLVLDLCTIFVQ